MKQLTSVGYDLLATMIEDAGDTESAQVDVLLKAVPDKSLALEIDRAVGAYVSVMSKASFLAGLEVGRNPLGWLVEVGD